MISTKMHFSLMTLSRLIFKESKGVLHQRSVLSHDSKVALPRHIQVHNINQLRNQFIMLQRNLRSVTEEDKPLKI